MAKIFRTESLSVNGDNIRLTSASANTYKLTTSAGATIMSKTNADIDSDVSSLKAVDVELDSDVSSLAAKITTNDVQVKSAVLAPNDTSETITFAPVFASPPSVVGSLKSTGASDPIIACQISAISTTSVTFQFSDEIPNGNYTLEILASV